MFYRIVYPLKDVFFVFNLFKYITFRSIIAAVVSFLIFMLFYPKFLKYIIKIGLVEKVKRDKCDKLYEYHAQKEGIPTSGGILIIASTIIATVVFGDILNSYVQLALSVFILLGLLGLWDDMSKLKNQKKGISKRSKILVQSLIGLFVGSCLYFKPGYSPALELPFLKDFIFNIGIIYIFFVGLVIVATSNAVNLTDGLDGLAVGSVIIAAIAFSIMAYLAGHFKLSDYLLISYVNGAGELTVFLAALVGACFGFLWHNAYPADIFMGDSGSMALGGAIATVAVIIKKEFLLLIIGGLFVIETISVLIQIFSFKTRGKRVFYFAPIHHHFQIKGWAEPKIIVRFWIIAIFFALLSLLTLKIR
jgi:phospho-N-acetylmuramoyl-pentapeptide-transferase